MGSTLEHGIYLPSEGEKNCYQGLAGNWNKVDGALGDVAELKQSIESKFTKEIVTELPTEDINPYCIYMILKTDPETDNVYDEWVYINNNWEYLGNTKVDMTQYYTKQEVNQLPAVASGVTATKVGNYDDHIANGDIHVTASDKAKWDTVALIKQLRLVNTQVGSATTIAFANIDDTNGIKVGDKCMDLDAKMFEITAVDTTNQTVTVGSALIDLALDSDVVHTSGDETVGGVKTFSSDIILQGTTTPVIKTISNIVQDTSFYNGSVSWVIRDKDNLNNILESVLYKYSSKSIDWQLKLTGINNSVSNTKGIRFTLDPVDNVANFVPIGNNTTSIGKPDAKWRGIYATNYYYGSNNVEFSTKFVTTDTDQSINGNKNFVDNIIAKKIVSSVSQLQINAKTNADSVAMIGGNSASDGGGVWIYGKNTSNKSMVTLQVYDTDNSTYHAVRLNMDGSLTPTVSNNGLGSSSYKWVSFNGLNPSSLGMPDTSNALDISGYITDLTGTVNTYTALANGYVSIRITGTAMRIAVSNGVESSCQRSASGAVACYVPVVAGETVSIYAVGTSINNAIFRPCLGNV